MRRVRAWPAVSSAGPALGSLALEGAGVGGYLAGPPAQAAGGDPDGGGESRAAGQLVGGGPAELEQGADVADADQPVGVVSSWPRGLAHYPISGSSISGSRYLVAQSCALSA